jgi:hypothetical protein
MTIDRSIFGLRFGSNASLHPTQEELRNFLESRKKENRRELHGNDLATYRELLEDVMSFQRHQQQGMPPQSVQQKMFYGVLSHSSFFSPALASAVEQFKYQLYALTTLDFKKPRAFIKSTEEAISKLNPKKKADAVKLAKMRGMAEERIAMLETLNKLWAELVEELSHLAMYIRHNLVKIEDRCEAAIVVLVDSHIARNKENQLIEDVKTQFKEQLKNDLHYGLITKQHIETAKHDVLILSKELSNIFKDDVYELTRLFEAIYDHLKKTIKEIDAVMTEIGRRKDKRLEEHVDLFAEIEKILVSLISDYQFELKAAEVRSKTGYENILLEKRKEMIDHLFDLLKKERRSWNRRSREDRRKQDLKGKEPIRRSGIDRRRGKDRRKAERVPL